MISRKAPNIENKMLDLHSRTLDLRKTKSVTPNLTEYEALVTCIIHTLKKDLNHEK